MRSATPKVLHRVAGRSLVGHVLEAAATVEPELLVCVVGHGRDLVVEHLAEIAPWALPVVQEEQHGTGHAVRVALDVLAGQDRDPAVRPGAGPVVVLTGDTPLLTGETLVRLVAAHEEAAAAATVLSAVLDDPTGYGRIVRDSDGHVAEIVEHKDAGAAVREIREINSGMYAFDPVALRAALGRLTRDNVQGEEYLTDVLGLLRADGQRVEAVVCADPTEIMGVNDRAQLAEAAALMRERINLGWMRAGVSILDPASTWIDVDADLEPDVTLLPETYLLGPTSVARGARVGPGTTLTSCEVGADATVVHTWAELAVIGPDATVGPFTFLRPGARLAAGAKAGAYVEIKNAVVGEGAKVPHLSYVGDADIGAGTNIGAATVFVNYDGVEKHRTVVGEQARIGSDSMLVAPVTIGDGAYTAAGSVITEDVPPGAMAVGRARQRTIDGWVERRRAGTSSARAAESARAAAAGRAEEHEQQEDR
jgi:bifunctional UDP-N-acetylglucosamine pyrophosphorylase/glucosamine-1-phosphate N-acetyltransferase